MILRWIPLKSVGPFNFGSLIQKYYGKFCLKYIPDEYNEKVGWDVYGISDEDIRIYFEEGKIEAVSCGINCIYNDMNMIGMKAEELISILGDKPDTVETEELSDGLHEVYDFDNLGLQIWTKKGIVVTAICSGYCDE